MKKFVSGLIIGSIITTSISALAGGVWDKIDVLKNDINIMVNGKQIFADNFVYNDTTYLPLRVVAEELGQKVTYDKATNTAYIGEKPVGSVNNSDLEKGTIPDPLYIQKDKFTYVTNDEFQLKLFRVGDPSKPIADIKSELFVQSVALFPILKNINEKNDTNYVDSIDGIYDTDMKDLSLIKIFDFGEYDNGGLPEGNLPLEHYYSVVAPFLRKLANK